MNRVSAPQYDWFKLIVTIVLLAILILMLLRGCAVNTLSVGLTETTVAPSEVVASLPPTAEAIVPSGITETFTPPAALASTATATEIVPTPTVPTATATETAATGQESATAEVTATVSQEATPAAVQDTSCPTSVPSRLAVGQKARVMQRLNMRTDASIAATIIHTNPTGTEVDIIGGPVCTPVGGHAYLWWQIRLPNGAEGWSAESQLNEAAYLLEPIQ